MAGDQARFLSGSTLGHVTRMTLAGTIGITFVFLVDAANLYWVSQLHDMTLMAAIGYVFPIQFLSISVGIGMMIASTALISRSIGQKNFDQARKQAATFIILAVSVQVMIATLLILFRKPIAALIGAEGEIAELAARYLMLTLPSLPIMAIGLVASASLRAYGDGKRAMFVTLASGIIAIVVDPALIVLLNLRLDGAAYGLGLSRCIMACVALYFATQTHNLIAKPRLAYVPIYVKSFFQIALPAMLTQISTPVGTALMTVVISQYGEAAVAAWAVINRLTVVVFGGIFSLSGAIGGIFGQNFGAAQFDRVRSTLRDAVIFCTLFSVTMWCFLMLLSSWISGLFELQGEAIDVLRAFTHFGAGMFLFSGYLFVSNAAFNSLGRPRNSMMLNWTRDGVLSYPLAILLSSYFAANGVIYAQGAAGFIAGLLGLALAYRYVSHLGKEDIAKVDLGQRRAYRDANRFRRR